MTVDIDIVRGLAETVLAVAAVGALIYRGVRNGQARMEQNIIKELRHTTAEIQPNKNGGKSLADANKKLDDFGMELREFKAEVRADIQLIKSAVLQLEDDVDGMK